SSRDLGRVRACPRPRARLLQNRPHSSSRRCPRVHCAVVLVEANACEGNSRRRREDTAFEVSRLPRQSNRRKGVAGRTEWGRELCDFIYYTSGATTTAILIRDMSLGLAGEFCEVFISTKPRSDRADQRQEMRFKSGDVVSHHASNVFQG